MRVSGKGHSGHKHVHQDEMTYAPAHDEQVKDFVRAKKGVHGIEKWQLQRIDDSANGIDNAARQKPSEGGGGECVYNLGKCQDAHPAHTDIEYGGKPFRAGNPESFDNDAGKGDGPYERTQKISRPVIQDDQADGGVCACDQDENHHMVELAQNPVGALCKVEGMVNRAGGIEKHHTEDKDSKRDQMNPVRLSGSLDQKRRCRKKRHHHADEVRDCTAGVFEFF